MCTPKKKSCAPPVVVASTWSQVQTPCSQINKIPSQDAEMTNEDLLQYLDKAEASPSNVQNCNQENNEGEVNPENNGQIKSDGNDVGNEDASLNDDKSNGQAKTNEGVNSCPGNKVKHKVNEGQVIKENNGQIAHNGNDVGNKGSSVNDDKNNGDAKLNEGVNTCLKNKNECKVKIKIFADN